MIGSLVLRNLRIFFRDRMSVFLALLSPIIMLALYCFFLGTVQSEDLRDKLPLASDDAIQAFVTNWVFAGILLITTLTTALASLQVFIEDRASGRFDDFAVSPLTRRQQIMGYFGSGLIITLGLSTVVFIVGLACIALIGRQVPSWQDSMLAYGYVVLSCACFVALSSFLVTFIRSGSAFTSLSVIIGTTSGFLAGIYIQPGTLSQSVVNVINSLPFAQAAALLRSPLTRDALEQLAGGNAQAYASLTAHYGIGSVTIGNSVVSARTLVITLVVVAVAGLVLGSWRLKRKLQ